MSERIEIIVLPRSSQNSIEETETGLRIKLTTPPVDGKANANVIAMLAKHFNVSKSSVSIIQGDKSKRKLVEIKKDIH